MHIGVDATAFRIASAGIVRYTLNMVSSLSELAPDLELTFYSPSPLWAELPNKRWRIRIEKTHGTLLLAYWLQESLPRMLHEDRVDVFWGHNHVLPLRLRAPCFRLLTLHDLTAVLFPHAMSLGARLAARLSLRRAVSVADLVLMDSVATAHLAARLGMNSRRRCVVYPGVEGHFRPVSEMEIREVRQKHGLPEKYILTVGTIEPRKNHPILLRAIERLPHAPVLAVVGGAGWRCSQVMRSLGRLEGDGRVLYLGRVDDHDMPGLYGGALFLVCPSLYEGFGLPVAEAMACGCPVLCSWSSSLPEVAGRAAEYFPLGSHDVLVDKISGLLASERRRREMVEMGLERAREFRYSTAAATVLRELQAVLRAKPRSGNADRICVHAEEMRTRTASRGRTARCRTDYLDLS